MNAERLHAIVIALNKEMTDRSIVERMQALVSALQTLVQQSPQPQHQQVLAANLKNMYVAVTDTPSDKFSPAWRQILSEMGGEDLFGNKLKENIEAAIARNQMTPAVTFEELAVLLKKLQEFKKGVEQAISALRLFNIGNEKLVPGDCEIGVLIPRDAVNNQLLNFAEELKELGFILNIFSEVATGKTDDLAIRTISSSDLLVYLSANAPYAACLSVAVERVVALYKQLLEIRKLRQGLQEQGVPDGQTTGIENYANQLMEKGIDKTSVEIVDEFYKEKDKGRKNELKIAVRLSMNKIANRIDRGFNLEVRVEPITPKDQKAGNEDLQKAIAVIQSTSANMQFLKLEGQPILKLPEGQEKPKKKEGRSKPEGAEPSQ